MTILIPSYKPDESMVATVRELREAAPKYRILVVDDGGGETYAPFFEQAKAAGATVLHHEVNRGKGAALKTGFAWLMENGETEGCVTADADGQHLTDDILKVAALVKELPDAMIIGGRKFNKPGVPLRSKFGNYATRFTYNLLCGQSLGDTQTGLRGVPVGRFADMLAIPGDRYEYEMNQLLCARSMDLELVETEIATVYLDEENSSSHFNPIQDALRVYKPVLLAGLGLVLAAIADLLVYSLIFFNVPVLMLTSPFIGRAVAMLIRGGDLFIRRRGRKLRAESVVDFLLIGVSAILFVCAFSYLFCLGMVRLQWMSMQTGLYIGKLLGDLLVVVFLCVKRAIAIRRVK